MVAAMERILPGAAEIGVPEHLEFWLRTEPFAPVRQQFDRAAEQLDGLARRRHQQAFADCAPGDQDALLKEFQEGKVRERDFDGANFFQRLVTFTMEGFLGDPKYGGNRREAGWRFVGHAPCWWSPRRIQRILNPDPRLKD
jgi:gluconate 2-dehydrogenase gamma chain